MQLRFLADPCYFKYRFKKPPFPINQYQNEYLNVTDGLVGGYKFTKLWPETLPEEDAIRAKGHVVLSKLDHLLIKLQPKYIEQWILCNLYYF